MDWDNLRFFLELARTGTLAGAARRLGVEHTTVSRRIQALEKQMGATLFAREDSIEESWRIVEPILTNYPPVEQYHMGSWGPAEARRMVSHYGGWPEEPPA